MLYNPCLHSEAPLSSAGEDLFTLDAVTRVYVTHRNYERPGGVEWVKADWGSESQATRVSWAGPMCRPSRKRLRTEATTCTAARRRRDTSLTN